jgi:hypothetical protein
MSIQPYSGYVLKKHFLSTSAIDMISAWAKHAVDLFTTYEVKLFLFWIRTGSFFYQNDVMCVCKTNVAGEVDEQGRFVLYPVVLLQSGVAKFYLSIEQLHDLPLTYF